jgi:putative transposase
MTRTARLVIPGQVMHVLARSHDQKIIFSDEADYRQYLNWIREAAKEFSCAIHAFALMPNHTHLLVTPQYDYSLAKLMQSLGRRYSQYFNRMHSSSGSIWEGRFCSSLIDPDYVLRVQRYIELNPVRAGLETRPEDCRNTSYQSHIGGKAEPWLIDHPSFWGLGNTPFERQMAWANFVKEGAPHHEDKAITEHLIRSKPWISKNFGLNHPKIDLANCLIKPRGRPKRQ